MSGLDYLGFDDVAQSAAEDVETLRACGYLPAGTVVWGAVYDVDTGQLRVVNEP